jgi:chemotaxis protein CheC
VPYSHALNETEADALNELINIGVNRAAGALRELVNEQVHLSVPSVALMTRPQVITALTALAEGAMVAVRETFSGEMRGDALLVFPRSDTMNLVAAVVSRDADVPTDMESFEDEALAETGNIILSNCLSTIANILQHNVRISLPSIIRGTGEGVMKAISGFADEVILYQHVHFLIKTRAIRGAIVMIMDVESLNVLKRLIHEFIERATGAGIRLPS